ncbi:MAG TPA: aromatic ring-hydroxylating dioxygenase subunit alpha [Thermoanaerobaculia bacterium]|nr:aromatic ring-hydroxylating dioxygenase subunit alpha [Thermoanaerobaculia bacterium]
MTLATDETTAELLHASPLAGKLYTDPAIFRREVDEIFGGLWLCAGREEAVPRPGDFLVRDLGDESIVVSRAEDGRLHAFYNVCRHRGARLLTEERGEGRRHFVCPYHAWTYGLDGQLQQAPLMADRPDFRCEHFPLVGLPVESWLGFFFLHLGGSGQEPPRALAEQVRDLPDLGDYDLPDLRVGARETYRVKANWKMLCENYAECYHCSLVHPQLHRISHFLSGGKQESADSFVGGPMKLRPGFDTMSLSGVSERGSLPGVRPEEHDLVRYYNVYPNFLISLHRDYVLTHTLWPLSPGETWIECEWLFHPDEMARPGFDPADAVEFWDVTNRQDWDVCERVQLGVRSRGYQPSRYQAGETCVYAFDQWYRERMGL